MPVRRKEIAYFRNEHTKLLFMSSHLTKCPFDELLFNQLSEQIDSAKCFFNITVVDELSSRWSLCCATKCRLISETQLVLSAFGDKKIRGGKKKPERKSILFFCVGWRLNSTVSKHRTQTFYWEFDARWTSARNEKETKTNKQTNKKTKFKL